MNTKNLAEGQEIIWKDRKRILGMPISFTRYYLVKLVDGSYKIYTSYGLLSTLTEEVKLYRIDDITVTVSLGEKIFGEGTLKLYCKDASDNAIYLRHIKNPFKVRDLITALIDKERAIRGMGYSEFQV